MCRLSLPGPWWVMHLEELSVTPVLENIISNKSELDWLQIQEDMRFIQERTVKMVIFNKW